MFGEKNENPQLNFFTPDYWVVDLLGCLLGTIQKF